MNHSLTVCIVSCTIADSLTGVTALGPGVTPSQGFAVEVLITFVLMMTVFAACDKGRNDLTGSAPLAIGLSITICQLAFVCTHVFYHTLYVWIPFPIIVSPFYLIQQCDLIIMVYVWSVICILVVLVSFYTNLLAWPCTSGCVRYGFMYFVFFCTIHHFEIVEFELSLVKMEFFPFVSLQLEVVFLQFL